MFEEFMSQIKYTIKNYLLFLNKINKKIELKIKLQEFCLHIIFYY